VEIASSFAEIILKTELKRHC